MSVDLLDLKEGCVYLIRYNFDKYRHYEGTFSQTRTINGELNPEFINCFCYIRQVEHIDHYSDSHYCLDKRDYYNNPNSINVFSSVARANFYDAKKVKTFDKVKNLEKSIQSRERRSANMILRQLIGDPNFQW
jgi:hypothetical protein